MGNSGGPRKYPCVFYVASSALMSAGSVCRYRYQLEAFIDRLRGRNPEHWHDAQDSVANMEWIEAIYNEVRHIVLSLAPIPLCDPWHQLLIDPPVSSHQ
jgi:hypothetical protein